MWRQLVAHGLRRCLFGVESGATSILQRFNKETTAEQNATAIRTLSALGVPTRYTYITFDQLMTADELRATYAFQGRTDLLLNPLPHLSVEQIIDGVHDEAFIAEHATGRGFYTGISYMLVSMECLIGAAYTRRATEAGLTDTVRPSMGRVDAEFADWRIGVFSRWGQMWVDRNFALDYTLKSLEKIMDGQPRLLIREARVVLKKAAYTLLGGMIDLLDATDETTGDRNLLDQRCRALAEAQIDTLRPQMTRTVARLSHSLPADRARVLDNEHERWVHSDTWQLINAADPCGT
jgi:hypothetical protein